MDQMVSATENEISAGIAPLVERSRKREYATRLVNNVGASFPSVLSAEASVDNAGRMLGNGSKCYVDEGNRIEIATPEVTDPLEALPYQRGEELRLLSVHAKTTREMGLAPEWISLLRCATDYNGMFCGFHQNFSTKTVSATDLIPFLVPFLVSRPTAGAGGFGPKGFAMTHKNRAIKCVASNDTRNNRSILDQRSEHLSNCTKRIHVCIGDQLMSDLSNYVTLGSTALVIKMIDDGAFVGPSLELLDPVEALQTLDSDLEWKKPLPLASGHHASGLEIQEHFLNCAVAYAEKKKTPWMNRVVEEWRSVLVSLRHAPSKLEDRLDPFIKRRFFREYLAKSGIDFEDFRKLIPSLWQLRSASLGETRKTRSIRERYRSRMPRVSFDLIAEVFAKNNVSWSRTHHLLGLLERLISFDLRYHEIDPETGLYWRLRDRGLVNSQLVSAADIKHAMSSAPKGTRAEVRAGLIRRFHTVANAKATWTYVQAGSGTYDLENPFQTTANCRDLGARRVGQRS